MNEKFFDLKKEKQDRMINAALKIFAENGYKHASTDDIVAEAGISKGLLFHYFINKLGLYTFLFDYSVRFMNLELSAYAGGSENDFFALFKQIETAKMQVLRNYPYMQRFIESTKYENVKEALLATEEKKNSLCEMIESFMSRADKSKLRPEVNIDKLRCMIEFTIQGLMTESFKENSFHPDMMIQEIYSYIDMLKSISDV